MSDVDVVVLDHDGGDLLGACLDSIARQTQRAANVIVVDNGSREPVSGRVGDSGATVIRNEENLGFAGGINEAMTRVDSPFVAWVNNDVTLDPAWLETLRAAFDDDGRLGAVQSVVMRRDGRVDGAGITIAGGTYRQRGHGSSMEEALAMPEAWGVSATAAIYRVGALRAVSEGDEILDSRFFAWYEDVELCARLREGGWSMRVVPAALATHAGSSTAAALGRRGERLRIANRYRVARMHPGVGSTGALVAEDARRIARAVVRGDVAGALRTAKFAAAGIFGRLD